MIGIKYALVWAELYGDYAYTPKVKYFSALDQARKAGKEKGREQSRIFFIGDETAMAINAKKGPEAEISTYEIREEMDREERCGLAGIPYEPRF